MWRFQKPEDPSNYSVCYIWQKGFRPIWRNHYWVENLIIFYQSCQKVKKKCSMISCVLWAHDLPFAESSLSRFLTKTKLNDKNRHWLDQLRSAFVKALVSSPSAIRGGVVVDILEKAIAAQERMPEERVFKKTSGQGTVRGCLLKWFIVSRCGFHSEFAVAKNDTHVRNPLFSFQAKSSETLPPHPRSSLQASSWLFVTASIWISSRAMWKRRPTTSWTWYKSLRNICNSNKPTARR